MDSANVVLLEIAVLSLGLALAFLFTPAVIWLRNATLKKAIEQKQRTIKTMETIQTVKALIYLDINLLETLNVYSPDVTDNKIAMAKKQIEDLNGYEKTNKELQETIEKLINLLR